jgi:ABC-type dipeptide/oligopeptide/nickel transport system ATPase component
MSVSQHSERGVGGVPAAVATCTPFAGSDPLPPVLTVDDLRVTVGHGRTEAVHGVSFQIGRGQIVGLVGASGSGKTLTCRAILGLNSPGVARSGGRILLGDTGLTALDRRGWDAVRGTRIGTVFQDPASYLNPSVTVGRQLAEALRIKRGLDRRAAREEALALFASVGLRNPETVYRQYPHELSGGMAQRVLIAIAVSGEPELLVADEATSSLDVLVQAGVLRLLRRLAAERGLALLLVTHDLAVVAEVCDRVLVCSDGELVEQGSAAAVIAAPEHAATRALVEAAAVWHPEPVAASAPQRRAADVAAADQALALSGSAR